MAHNKISDLRDHLFEVIERLKDDEDKSMDLDKARVIAEVAGKIIDSAKVEVDYIKVTGLTKSDSEFLKPINPVQRQITKGE